MTPFAFSPVRVLSDKSPRETARRTRHAPRSCSSGNLKLDDLAKATEVVALAVFDLLGA